MKQQLFIFPNTNSLFNILKHIKISSFNTEHNKGFIIQSDYNAKTPITKLNFTQDNKTIERFFNSLTPNETTDTRVAYEYAIHTANLFPWQNNTEKEIIFFYHRQPNTPNHFYNEMHIDAFKEIETLKKKNVSFNPVYIKNPHNKISQWNNHYLNNWQDINNLLINIEDYTQEDTKNKDTQLIQFDRDTNAKDFIKKEQLFFQSSIYLENNKNPTLHFNNKNFKELTSRKVKQGEHLLYKLL